MRPRHTPSLFYAVCLGLLQAVGAFATDPAAGMQRIGKVTLSTSLLRSLYNGLIDPVAGFGYFTTAAAENPGWIVKVDLKGPVPVEVAAIPVAQGEGNLLAGAIDPLAGYAYIGSAGNPGKVIKIALGKGSAPPVYLGSTPLAPPARMPASTARSTSRAPGSISPTPGRATPT